MDWELKNTKKEVRQRVTIKTKMLININQMNIGEEDSMKLWRKKKLQQILPHQEIMNQWTWKISKG